MKKNVFLRIALVVLVLTLATACMVSATLAKYVTSESGSDSARVAKFDASFMGIQEAEWDLFDTTSDTGVSNGNLIAPGTTGFFQFSVDGTSEVAVSVVFAVEVTDEVNGAVEDYNPLAFTLTKIGEVDPLLEGGTLAQLEAAIEALSSQYEAGTAIDATYSIDWVWDFDDSGAGTNDEDDTTLGMSEEDLDVSISITCTITQLDE